MANSDAESFEDELDKISIDQMHKAVLQFSSNCFELKKLCATVLVSGATLIATFTDKQLDLSIFIAGVMVTLFFWLLDSQSYYYQEKLRANMKIKAENMAERHNQKTVVDGVGLPLSEEREQRKVETRVLNSLFNNSMFFYLVLAFIIVILAILFEAGYITSYPSTKAS